MPQLRKAMDGWYRLSSDEANNRYYIPRAIAYDEKSAFYTDCDGQIAIPDDVTCKFVGLVADGNDSGLVTFYPGNFSLSDLFDLYDAEVLESGDFSFLEVSHGLLSLNKELTSGLAAILDDYASEMPESHTIRRCTFHALSETEVERYRFPKRAGSLREVYRLVVHPLNDEPTQDVVMLVSLSHATERPTIHGIVVTRFREEEFRNNPEANALFNGQGCIALTREAVLELAAMLREQAQHLSDGSD